MSPFAKKFPAGHWSFLGPGSVTKWNTTDKERQGGEWDRVAELMMTKFRDSGHPVFQATSALYRGQLKSKGGGKLSIHFCADGETIETVFRTIISVNQLSIYGAVAELCEEYGTSQTSMGRPVLTESSDPSFCTSKPIDNDTHTFGRDSCTRRSITETQETRGKPSRTRSIDQSLY